MKDYDICNEINIDMEEYPAETMGDWEKKQAYYGFRQKLHQNSHRKWWVSGLTAGIAMIALVCSLALPQMSRADSVHSFWKNILMLGDEDVSANIKENVYEDRGEHITMQVKEFLTDGTSTYVTVKYSALDEKGEEWLQQMSFDTENLAVAPRMLQGKEQEFKLGWESDTQEVTSNQTEKNIVAICQASNRYYGSEQIVLTYPMEGQTDEREVYLSAEPNIEILTYELQSSDSPSKYYTPKYMEVSALSFTIYGKNEGAYEEYYVGETYECHSLLEDDTDEMPEVVLYQKDGEQTNFRPFCSVGAITSKVENHHMDLEIQHGIFCKDGKNSTINPYDITGLEINGVYYELKQ
jgi:hypothetical protein